MNYLLCRFTFVLALLCATAPVPAGAQGTGEFLCSLGSRDGQPCESFDDCPGGICVIAQGVCPDGFICDCPAGSCTEEVLCSLDEAFGTCSSGTSVGRCCDVALECLPGDACVGAHKLCVGGQDQGFSCLDSTQCRGGDCVSTGCFCDAGDFDGYPCVGDGDCPGGGCDCSFAPNPTPTPIGSTCPGDCSRDGQTTVDEILLGVNIALGDADLSVCPVFDADSDAAVTVNELLAAIDRALNGC
ncbi:MAG TPA: hypothetical protein VEB21_15985 [Terriglobales bacterium]|nr:hypothetical protein [Terriglobales bacterium]